MVSSIGLATSRIASVYQMSQSAMADSLAKLSSGKNFLQPKDGVGEFFVIDRLSRDRRIYEILRRDLEHGAVLVSAAEDVSMQLVEGFRELKRITSNYWEATPGSTERTLIENEFNATLAGMQSVVDSAVFNGKNLVQAGTLTSMMVNPNDITQTLDVTYAAGDIVDLAGLTVDGGVDYQATVALIDTENGKALSYLSKTSGYIQSISSQISITNIIIENSSEIESVINDVDDAKEMKELITQQIRQQASLSMMAQANMMRFSLLRLFE